MNQPKKKYYIVVTPFFPTESVFRGPFIYDQVKALINQGKNVVVFKPGHSDYDFEGVHVNSFRIFRLPSLFLNGITSRWIAASFMRKLRKLGINVDDIEYVHCHTVSFGCCGLALKELNKNITVLLQHHDKDPYMVLNGRLAGWKPNLQYRARKSIDICNRVDYHICISNIVKNHLTEFPAIDTNETYRPYLDRLAKLKHLRHDTSNYRCIILHNGVDPTKFYPLNLNRDRSIVRIGCVADFIGIKSQMLLLQAIKEITSRRNPPRLEVYFIGEGYTKPACQRYVAENHLESHVSFFPERRHRDMNEFYNNLDLFILPSRFEGFGCVNLEAAACNIPFIIANNQGTTEYIVECERDRWTFNPNDPADLPAKIDAFLALHAQLVADHNDQTAPFPNPQHLAFPTDINILVGSFLNALPSK